MTNQTRTDGYISIHQHTEYSLLDGQARIEPLVLAAKAMGMPALAISDHGNMYGAVEFYKTARKHGIKPILGCEVYMAPRSRHDRDPQKDRSQFHLTLLAENNEGYKNLLKLVSKASLEGFYYKPRVDKELLAAHNKGLIAMSGCLAGEIPELLLGGDSQGASRVASWYKELFGDRFFLELMDHDLQEEKKIIPNLLDLSKRLGIPLVATNDSHYIKKEDAYKVGRSFVRANSENP